jgi:hypothetical protein
VGFTSIERARAIGNVPNYKVSAYLVKKNPNISEAQVIHFINNNLNGVKAWGSADFRKETVITVLSSSGIAISFGMSCGILGINAAHELGHRVTWYEQLMSKMLLLTTLYMHFFIEHNRGHHKNVSTDEDPASSRLGELVYLFYFRSIYGSFISAWKLESERLKRLKFSFWSFKNEMIVYQFLQASLILVIFYFFGMETTLFFLISATIGILLLETVNYIEHYGLRRKKKEKGYRVNTIEAINSNKADAKQCTWICHNNTLYCKKHHTKWLKTSFPYTDPIYFGTIRLLMATGNYGAANILLYVVFFPLTIGVLIIWNRHLTIKIATLKKHKNGNN